MRQTAAALGPTRLSASCRLRHPPPLLPPQAPCTTRLLLLDEGIDDLQLTKLPDELRDYVAAEGGEPVRHSVTIGCDGFSAERVPGGPFRNPPGTLSEPSSRYDKFSAEQVLRRLLPEGMEVPSAFEQVVARHEAALYLGCTSALSISPRHGGDSAVSRRYLEQVGHVAHMNLREEHLPYKALIGEVRGDDQGGRLDLGSISAVSRPYLAQQVLLDKNPRLRSVVNKADSLPRPPSRHEY